MGAPENRCVVKPATDTNDSGIIETTTRRRVIPVSDPQDNRNLDIWDYLRSITPQDWSKHIVYGYRVEPGPKIQIFRCTEQLLTLPSGQRVPVADEQELEGALTREFGGGVYRLLVKKGPQIISAGNLEIGAPPRQIKIPVDPAQNGNGGTGPQISLSDASATAQVAGRAMDALTLQERQSAEIGFAAMRTAADVMQRFAVPANSAAPAAAPTQMEQAFQMLMLKMMEKMIDRLDAAPAQSASGLTEKILGVAVDRMLNPAPTGAPVSAAAELVRSLPSIGAQFVEGVRALAEARKSEAQILAMSQRPPGAAMQPNPQVLPPAASPQAQPTAAGAPTMDFVFKKIVEIFQRPTSADQAADDAMAFLDELHPTAVADLAKLGEEGLLTMFHQQPLLRPATANPQRLVEFIRSFLKMHAEDVAGDQAAPPAAQPQKPLPN